MNEQPTNITIDPGRLPIWVVAQAINLSYTEACVRLANALSMNEFLALRDFEYRFFFSDVHTGERRFIVQRGGEEDQGPAFLPFETAVSILAIIRLKDYTATYGTRNVVSCYFSGKAEGEGGSDMSRVMILLHERDEFGMYMLSKDVSDDAFYMYPVNNIVDGEDDAQEEA